MIFRIYTFVCIAFSVLFSVQDAPGGILFTFSDQAAQTVYIAGSMNDWDVSSLPMSKSLSGDWDILIMPRRSSLLFHY